MIRRNESIAEVASILQAESFYSDASRKIFAAILALNGRGVAVDLVTLAEEIDLRKWVQAVGGFGKLAELWDAAPSASNVMHYAAIVKEKSMLRGIIQAGQDMVSDAYDPVESAASIIERSEKTVFRLADQGVVGGTFGADAAVRESMDRMQARQENNGSGTFVPTGLDELDGIMAGGLYEGELIVLAARTSVGKTALACNVIRLAASAGNGVFVVSLEMSRVELMDRILCAEAHVNTQDVRKGRLTEQDQARLQEAGSKVRRLNLEIDDWPTQNVLRIASLARRLKTRKGLRLVVIDYLQLIEPESRRDPRHEQVAAISRRLKLLAREIAVPILCLAQLNRQPDNRSDPRPRLADLRESGAVEQDSDTVILLHQPADKEGVLIAKVAKQRNGPVDETPLSFFKEHQRFDNFVQPIFRGAFNDNPL